MSASGQGVRSTLKVREAQGSIPVRGQKWKCFKVSQKEYREMVVNKAAKKN